MLAGQANAGEMSETPVPRVISRRTPTQAVRSRRSWTSSSIPSISKAHDPPTPSSSGSAGRSSTLAVEAEESIPLQAFLDRLVDPLGHLGTRLHHRAEVVRRHSDRLDRRYRDDRSRPLLARED